jgi:FMN phosphatase YigB (HAD superfamily)
MRKKELKAVVFDVGGVLAGGYSRKGKSVHESMAKRLKIEIDHWFDSIDSNYVGSMEGRIEGMEAVRQISKNLETDPQTLTKIWMAVYKRLLKPNKELYNLAFKIRRNGYKIGILSDQWYLSNKALIPNTIRKKFDAVVVSCDVGARKPGVKIFQILVKRLRLQPEEIPLVR